ncbi:ComEC/Rec2 family competence protein [Paracoccus aestuarii]|uniref:ComEC/Rec2 family competence protein n=1 Tax=Paracoccus aestuarii TaxID=453842 RepID=A0A418ZQ82_9RHOB|nr:ComEC/Rec2 family competence protein [Paracoccus aestuarii]RJK97354.1 ComEC/Rec2 family competence protein [Paracoccus aestuarii]WCQ99653.1 ComEC/Rec2 family competence protein [Paracoccus aestuarii]
MDQTGAATAPLQDRARPALRPRPPAALRAGLFPWVPVCLAAGIGLWLADPFLPRAAHWAVIATLAAACLALARAAPRWGERGAIGWPLADGLHLAALAGCVLVTGFGLAAARGAITAAPVMEWRYYGPVEGRVVQIDRSGRDRLRLTLDRVVLRDTGPERTPRRVRLSLMAEDDLPPLGQRVMLTGHLGPPPPPASPGSFDFRLHAWFDGLGAVGYTRTPIMAVAAPEGGLWWMHRARMSISAAIRDRIGGQAGAVAAALMTGDRSGIAESTNEAMRASNLYHIISISGLHMGMLAGFVYAGARLVLVGVQGSGRGLGRPMHKWAAGIALAAAAAYLWLSGGGVATERAFIMVAVMLGAIMADRRAISLRTVALAATVILIYSPEAVASAGFQMSFGATIALILVFGPWSRMAPHLPWWVRPVAMLVVSSLVAAAATSPIAAAHFNRMAQYGLLANLLAVPVMGTLVMPAGVIGAILSLVGLEGPALWVMGMGTTWMLMVADFVAGLGGAVMAVPKPPGAVVPLMGFGAVLAILCWRGPGRGGRLTGAGLMAGLAMLAASGAIWAMTPRPLLLIAPEGEAVGLMTPAGRAISKPSGGAFIVSTWLQEDGDMADQAQAAERPAFSGDRRDRVADLPQGWQLWHLTGKGAADRALPACRARRIVVSTETVTTDGPPACLLLDPRRMRDTGALAIGFGADGPRLRATAPLRLGGRAPR